MAHIDYYMFTLSPFTYLAGNKLEKLPALMALHHYNHSFITSI